PKTERERGRKRKVLSVFTWTSLDTVQEIPPTVVFISAAYPAYTHTSSRCAPHTFIYKLYQCGPTGGPKGLPYVPCAGSARESSSVRKEAGRGAGGSGDRITGLCSCPSGWTGEACELGEYEWRS